MIDRAVRVTTGCYRYRGRLITNNHDSEDYAGWWQVSDLDSLADEADYFPTKRAAIAAINADPPADY